MNRQGKLHALLSTARIANVPSVVSNVWLGVVIGWMATAAVSFGEAWRLALAGIFLYISGNFLNDWMDQDWDAVHRPERALPAGLFRSGAYLGAGGLFAVLGMAFAASVNGPAGWVAPVIVVFVAIYTWCHKRTAWSVIPMGLCRAFLPIMGAAGSLGTDGRILTHPEIPLLALVAGSAIFCYIVGLSLSARSEAEAASSRSNRALSRALLVIAPLLMMAAVFRGRDPGWIGLIAPVVYCAWLALAMGRFRYPVSRHVSALLAGIPLLDWMFLLPLLTGPLTPQSLVSALLPPLAFVSALLLQRLASAT